MKIEGPPRQCSISFVAGSLASTLGRMKHVRAKCPPFKTVSPEKGSPLGQASLLPGFGSVFRVPFVGVVLKGHERTTTLLLLDGVGGQGGVHDFEAPGLVAGQEIRKLYHTHVCEDTRQDRLPLEEMMRTMRVVERQAPLPAASRGLGRRGLWGAGGSKCLRAEELPGVLQGHGTSSLVSTRAPKNEWGFHMDGFSTCKGYSSLQEMFGPYVQSALALAPRSRDIDSASRGDAQSGP